MLTRTITYEDFNGNTQTEKFYFNITKTEALDLELGAEGGYAAMAQKMIDDRDGAGILEAVRGIILGAYGQKSEDGKRFIKTQQMRDEFAESAAFDALFTELATSDVASAEFMSGVLPKDLTAGFSAGTPTETAQSIVGEFLQQGGAPVSVSTPVQNVFQTQPNPITQQMPPTFPGQSAQQV